MLPHLSRLRRLLPLLARVADQPARNGIHRVPNLRTIVLPPSGRNRFSCSAGSVYWPRHLLLSTLLLVLFGSPASALAQLSWTDWADLALAAPAVLAADIRDIDRPDRRAAPDVPAGEVRALVQGSVRTVLKAPAVFPAGAAWLWQGPADARGRPPFVKASPVLLFATPLAGGSKPEVQALRLISGQGQQPWSAEREALVRTILREAKAGGAPMVTGVTDAARTAGDVEGQSESQIFLSTEAGAPLTMIVRRLAGAAPLLLVASGELVSTAVPVERETLLWRALACGLPVALPTRLAGDALLEADYQFALSTLGACGRTMVPPA